MKKDTNPKDALGIKKVPLHCVPCGPLYELGLAMMEGGRKYGTHNYRVVGVRASVYYDAIMRHVMAWWEGEDIDSDSGIHHLIKAVASIVVMRDGMLMNNYIDDRPVKYSNGLNISEFNKKAGDIIEKYPVCVAPYLAKNKPFVCSAGWTIKLNDFGVLRKGWYVEKSNQMYSYLHKNLTIHDNTGFGEYKFGEAPGYWPTKEAAEKALTTYLTKGKS